MGVRALFAACLLSAPLAAQAAVIDFDALDASPTQTLLTSFSEDGFTFSVSFVSDGDSPGIAVFDTTCIGQQCNGDTDLVPAVQGENGIAGNILIFQEPNVPIPDDDFDGGLMTLTLTAGSDFRFLGGSAIDDTVFEFGTSIDGVLGTVPLTLDSQTGKTTFTSSVLSVGDSITIRSYGSGGIDSLIVQAVPVPASLPLMIGAFAGLGLLRRHRKRA